MHFPSCFAWIFLPQFELLLLDNYVYKRMKIESIPQLCGAFLEKNKRIKLGTERRCRTKTSKKHTQPMLDCTGVLLTNSEFQKIPTRSTSNWCNVAHMCSLAVLWNPNSFPIIKVIEEVLFGRILFGKKAKVHFSKARNLLKTIKRERKWRSSEDSSKNHEFFCFFTFLKLSHV